MRHPIKIFLSGVALACAFASAPVARPFHGGAASPPVPAGGFVSDVVVYNAGGSPVINQPVTMAVGSATSAIATSNRYELRKSNGVTVVPVQEDGCSTWNQDNSRKVCSVSFVEPDSLTSATSTTYKLYAVAGAPNTTPNVSNANITGNTDIEVKTTSLTEADGTPESGTWDLVSLNYVLNNCSQYNGTTGFGSNPKCGWEVTHTGPKRYSIHAFQYPQRESDGFFQKWIRTDIWVDFWGSGSTPCSCSIAVQFSQPNTFGPISGATVGPTTETGYVFAAQVLNGANVIYNLGGGGDSRVVSTLTSANFNTTTGNVSLPGGSWTENTSGIFPIAFTSSGSMPTGLASGQAYWASVGMGDNFLLYAAACYASQACSIFYNQSTSSTATLMDPAGNYIALQNVGNGTAYVKFCPSSSCVATTSDTPVTGGTTGLLAKGVGNTYIAYIETACSSNCFFIASYRQGFSTSGSGTLTAIPLIQTTPWAGILGLDSKAQRFWINSAGTVGTAPPLLIHQDFTYLTQNSKALPPYLRVSNGTTLEGNLLAVTPVTYYPGTYLYPWDMNTTGDNVGDPRIGYVDHNGVYALYMPNDAASVQNTLVTAAGFSQQHMYHIDEHVGLPDVFNNRTYITLGAAQPNQRTYPYSGGTAWLTPSTATVDTGPISERYGTWLEPSHMPVPSQVPYLKTGQPEWQNQMVQEANAIIGNMQITSATVGGNTYYRVGMPRLTGFNNNQTRGGAWEFRAVSQADFFQPANSAISQYLHDLVGDDAGYMDDYATNGATANEKSLGYLWNDWQAGGNWQWWQDDYVFLAYGLEAWRGEYTHATSFISNYFYKQALTRMDAASAIGGGGCMWAGPARIVAPSLSTSASALPTTWSAFFTATAANDGPDFGNQNPWPGCGSVTGGLVPDSAGTNPSVPSGIAVIGTITPAIATLLGLPNASTLYTTLRNFEYTGGWTGYSIPLSFQNFLFGGQHYSEPVFAIAPLGAVN